MGNKLNLTRDINGFNAFGLDFSDTNYSATLVTSTDTILTVPKISSIGGASYQDGSQPYWLAVMEYDPGTSVWVALNTTANTPGGSSLTATASQLNPSARRVKGGDILHFFTNGTGVSISICFYYIGQ